MNDDTMNKLVEILLDQLYQLEIASDDHVNEDFSIQLMEQAAAKLQRLDADQARAFLEVVDNMARKTVDQGQKEYLQEFGDNFGITDVLT
ncbi:hypothetical protein [Yoonia sp. R2-816]|uniref:hypothetical protein n=1 Tax=Yoonia sp. R2-816 TaxID=3342638 RepID=UPI00372689E5